MFQLLFLMKMAFADSHRENDVGDFTSLTVNNDGTVKDFTVPKITYFK